MPYVITIKCIINIKVLTFLIKAHADYECKLFKINFR
jgi:hypothetical protein